ncbi:MAG TPA: hypothetical protein VEU51_10470 [Candidatus Acidoferrales bacterium]|nr:hypothetical protein [Candidatus Acidoferrales bacterium]
MPRKKGSSGNSSAFVQVQRQARALLVKLRKDLRKKESELNRLRGEEARLSTLIGRAGGRASVAAAGASGRVNWKSVLAALPKHFKAADVRKVRGLREKRPSEIFAAITRWIEAGTARRRARGVYERI